MNVLIKEKRKVKDLWVNSDTEKEYRVWAPQKWWESQGPKEEFNIIKEALNNKKIRIHTGEDNLRWGFKPKGFLTIKEAYNSWTGYNK